MHFLMYETGLTMLRMVFRKGRSCEDHIFSLISQIRQGIDHSGNVFCCYIDFQKAFDFLDRKILFLKLLRAGVDGKFYWALKSALSATSSSVSVTRFGCSQDFRKFWHQKDGCSRGAHAPTGTLIASPPC